MLSKLFKQIENEYCQEQQKKKDEQAKEEERWKDLHGLHAFMQEVLLCKESGAALPERIGETFPQLGVDKKA